MSTFALICYKCQSLSFRGDVSSVSLKLVCTGCQSVYPLLLEPQEVRYLKAMHPIPPIFFAHKILILPGKP